MFTSKETLLKKTGEDGIGRLQFLEALVDEFKKTKSKDAREQVLANLANFAYDPINYEYFHRLQIINLFLEIISTSSEENLIHFALAGLCNACLDPYNQQFIVRHDGVRYISLLLSNNHEETIINALSTLMFLITPESKEQILTEQLRHKLESLKDSDNVRIKNLAIIFLEDYFQENR